MLTCNFCDGHNRVPEPPAKTIPRTRIIAAVDSLNLHDLEDDLYDQSGDVYRCVALERVAFENRNTTWMAFLC